LTCTLTICFGLVNRFNKRLAAIEHEVIGSPDAIQSHHAAFTAAQLHDTQQQQQIPQQQQHKAHDHRAGKQSAFTKARSRIDKLEQLAGAAAVAKSHEERLKAIEQQLKLQADQWDMSKAQDVLDTWMQRPHSSQQQQQQQQRTPTARSFKPANAASLDTKECAAQTLQAWARHSLNRNKQQENAVERAAERVEESSVDSSADSSLPTPPAAAERAIPVSLHVSTHLQAMAPVKESVRLSSTTTNSTTNSHDDAAVPIIGRTSSAVGTPALLLTGESHMMYIIQYLSYSIF
jgi:hypothetical protein